MITMHSLIQSLNVLKIEHDVKTDNSKHVVSFDTNSKRKRNVNVQFVFDVNGRLLEIEGDE